MLTMDIEDFSQRYFKQPSVTLTSAAETVSAKSVWVDYLSFCNKDSSGHTVTVKDGNGKYFMNVSVASTPTDSYVVPIPEGGLYFANGIAWNADANSAVDAWIRLRYA